MTRRQGDRTLELSAFANNTLSSQGNVKFQTLRAFTRDEMNGILSKLPK